jgi:hypothetical protein
MSAKLTEVSNADVVRRLDIIIGILLETTNNESTLSTTEKIVRLTEMGMSPSEISGVIGKPGNYVAAALAQRRRVKRHGRKGT